ncbi:MAG: Crp/Fnr family transcriptional regulator [Bacilli bacterium]|nr:Crp/Fnr family transcriptional regulator [Bacilli bacterium]
MQNHPLFKNVIKDYQKFFRIKKYNKNDMIFNENSECRYLCLVLKGAVLINTYTFFEEEYNIITINENDLFGEFLLFHTNPFFLGDVSASKATELALITKDKLLSILQNDTTLLNNYLSIMSDKSIALQQKVKILSQKSIKDKVLFFLSETSKRTKSKIIKIKSKEQLALFLNIPRPSLSRELIILKNLGLINYSKNYIKLLD